MSERRYTAQEMREMAKSMTYGDDESSMEFVVAEVGDNLTIKESVDETNTVAAMLRQAADAEEENSKLKARLEAVVKECENIISHYDKVILSQPPVTLVIEARRVLRAARGNGGAE